MNDAQIKHMVSRFLGWRLPDTFSPDGGISYEPVGNKGTAHEFQRNPTGTNVLDYTQAEAMVRYMLDGLPFDGERPPGIDPKTGEYSTAQMLRDECYGGDTSQPLDD